MKKIRRFIASASDIINAADDGEDALVQAISDLKDDFDYIISGFEKMDRIGAEEHQNALVIAEQLKDTFNSVISQIAEKVTE